MTLSLDARRSEGMASSKAILPLTEWPKDCIGGEKAHQRFRPEAPPTLRLASRLGVKSDSTSNEVACNSNALSIDDALEQNPPGSSTSIKIYPKRTTTALISASRTTQKVTPAVSISIGLPLGSDAVLECSKVFISTHPRTERDGSLVCEHGAEGHLRLLLQRLHRNHSSSSYASLPKPQNQIGHVTTPAYRQFLEAQGLLSVHARGFDWSGKGQHVEFDETDKVPLTKSHTDPIGVSPTAMVDKVHCKGIMFARKTMRCARRRKLQDFLPEIEHLSRLRHAHIVQLVGSYLLSKRVFVILLYPVADCHLGDFLEKLADRDADIRERGLRIQSPRDFEHIMQIQIKLEEEKDALRGSLACLSHALNYIHSQTTKHMDIKPANILVKHIPSAPRARRWRFYVADFGHSRHFKDEEQSQTAGPVGTTPKWRAPEVYDKDVEGTSRGRSADVFSLGCVFLETVTVVCGKHLDDFTDFRNGGTSNDGPTAFCLHVPRLLQWVDVLRQTELESTGRPVQTELEIQEGHRFDSLLQLVASMVQLDPSCRPAASVVSAFFRSPPGIMAPGTAPNDYQHRGCCDEPPEPFASMSFG